MRKRVLLGGGVVALVWWVTMDVVGSLRYPGYSYLDQTISELGAQGAPTKVLMTVASGLPYALLMGAFGVGVWLTGGEPPCGALHGSAGGLIGPASYCGSPIGWASTSR
jgi:hypothetical protein